MLVIVLYFMVGWLPQSFLVSSLPYLETIGTTLGVYHPLDMILI